MEHCRRSANMAVLAQLSPVKCIISSSRHPHLVTFYHRTSIRPPPAAHRLRLPRPLRPCPLRVAASSVPSRPFDTSHRRHSLSRTYCRRFVSACPARDGVLAARAVLEAWVRMRRWRGKNDLLPHRASTDGCMACTRTAISNISTSSTTTNSNSSRCGRVTRRTMIPRLHHRTPSLHRMTPHTDRRSTAMRLTHRTQTPPSLRTLHSHLSRILSSRCTKRHRL